MRAEEASTAAATAAASSLPRGASSSAADSRTVRIVLITGFESFNLDLYNRAAEMLRVKAPGTQLKVGHPGLKFRVRTRN
jgi:hypothetical protein